MKRFLLLSLLSPIFLPAQVTCDTFRLKNDKGKDALLWNIMPDNNYGTHPDFLACTWTWNGLPDSCRSLLQFDFNLPFNAVVTSAALDLYFNPGSSNPGHSQLSGSNDAWLRRVTSPWTENGVTWNNQPFYTL